MFEGDLAHTAAVHLKENEYVYIAGHLSPLSSPINLTNGKVKLQVVLCFFLLDCGISWLFKSNAV